MPFPSPKHESESEVAQSRPTLLDPMDCSLPGSSVHGIFQARVLEWGAIAFSHPYPGPICGKDRVGHYLNLLPDAVGTQTSRPSSGMLFLCVCVCVCVCVCDNCFSPYPPYVRCLIHFLLLCLVAKSCPTLCDPIDCSPSGSSVREISQARILEWVAISYSKLAHSRCLIHICEVNE